MILVARHTDQGYRQDTKGFAVRRIIHLQRRVRGWLRQRRRRLWIARQRPPLASPPATRRGLTG